MPVYDASGVDLYGVVYDAEAVRLYQAYDADGYALITESYDLTINTDASSGPSSGYTLESSEYENTYVLRLLADWSDFNFQSVIMNTDTDVFNRMDTGDTVNRFSESMQTLADVTLQSTGGHKNDAVYYDGKMYMLDGTAANPRYLYVWDTDANSVQLVVLPISNNPNGSVRVVAGIAKSETEGVFYLVSRDQYNGSDIDHQTGDVMNVYRYDPATNTARLMKSFAWDCVYVQGAAFYKGILYVTCNSPTTGSASNYTGITVKAIRTDTWRLIDELTLAGNFEPEGMDAVDFTEYGEELTMGIVRYGAISKFIRFTHPYELTPVNI